MCEVPFKRSVSPFSLWLLLQSVGADDDIYQVSSALRLVGVILKLATSVKWTRWGVSGLPNLIANWMRVSVPPVLLIP